MLRELHEGYMRRRLAEVRVHLGRGSPDRPSAWPPSSSSVSTTRSSTGAATVAFQREVRALRGRPPAWRPPRPSGTSTASSWSASWPRGRRPASSGLGDDRLRTLQLFGAVHWMWWTWSDLGGAPQPGRGGRLVRGHLPRRRSSPIRARPRRSAIPAGTRRPGRRRGGRRPVANSRVLDRSAWPQHHAG